MPKIGIVVEMIKLQLRNFLTPSTAKYFIVYSTGRSHVIYTKPITTSVLCSLHLTICGLGVGVTLSPHKNSIISKRAEARKKKKKK